MLAMLLGMMALAAAPHGDLHVSGGVGAEGSGGALAGGSLGVRVHPRLRGTLRIDGGLFPDFGPGFTARPELRFTVSDPSAVWGRFDLVGGLGPRIAGGVGELGFAGIALDVPGPRPLDLRVEGGYLFDRNGLGAAVLAIGPVFDVRRKQPEPEPEPIPEPEPPAPVVAEVPDTEPDGIVTDLEGVEVWLPHPVCRWMPLDEANKLLQELGGGEVQVAAPGHRSRWLTVDGQTPLSLMPLAKIGSLVVVTAVGDRVELDGAPVAVNEDGVLMLSTKPGLVVLEVVGNGRRETLELPVAAEVTTWARARSPQTLHVTFPADSAVLSTRGLREIEAIAKARGDARFTVEGSFSPEGDLVRNRALAADRARAGVAALVAAGVPEDQIDLITEPKQIDSTDWRVLRAAVITPSGMPR
ncbi:MAG: hypothetical protein EP330_04425 [Deltaproteobacteria bacterium]|nr:MAG: hypothetical protein EP330_04425 [Deltaproteobacteria bacterium]